MSMSMLSCPDSQAEGGKAGAGSFDPSAKLRVDGERSRTIDRRSGSGSGRGQKAEHFSQLIGKVIDALTGGERLGEEEIERAWRRAAGEAAARHSRPVSFKKASLVVNVASSSWLYELTVRKREIVKTLESELKGKKIKELRFRIGDIKEAK